jgi:hypothetical protein
MFEIDRLILDVRPCLLAHLRRKLMQCISDTGQSVTSESLS